MATTLNLSLELDPVFLRGLGYLHSKTKDSAEKLKALLDESMSRGSEPSYRSSLKDMEIPKSSVSKLSLSKQDSKSSSSSSSPSSSSSSSSKSLHSEKSKKEAEKRPAEKVRVDPVEVDPPKKQRLEKQENRSSPVTVQTSRDLPQPSAHDYDETNADDFAMEMGLACVMCRQMTVTMGNQLVECQECHNLYHQDCHKPQVTDKEANDPRLIWYCARCTRQMKRMAQKAQKPPQKSSPVAASVAPVVKDPLVKKVEVKSRPEAASTFQAFKRTELKTTPSSAMASTKAASSGSSANSGNTTNNNNTAGGQKPTGLSGLAGTKTGPGATKAPGGNGGVSSGTAPSKQPPPLTLGGKQTISRSSSGEGQGKAPSGGGGSPGSSQHGSGGNGGGSNGNGGNGNNNGNGSKQAAAPGDKAPTSQESQLNAMKRLQMVKKKAAQKKLKK
ncbi:hypothetical protein CRUP_033424 [Coryphaenoides rupestris]|nr:hypothetical protein CRUP_033424 [Coryphaenoides rupestris]